MLRGQDIVLLVLLRLRPSQPWTYQVISREIGLSVSQCHMAHRRLHSAGLLDSVRGNPWQVREASCIELILHGIKYFFPPEIGAQVRGIPTAGSAPFVEAHFASSEAQTMAYVWPDPEGGSLGRSLKPIHPCQMRFAPEKNDTLTFNHGIYEAMVCIDLLRVGWGRERVWAADELKKRLHGDK